MTTTITTATGFTEDMDDTSRWTEHENGLVASIATNGDVLTITGTCDNVADEYVYYTQDIADISTTTYPYALVKWKTSVASGVNGLQAKIGFLYTTAADQVETLGKSSDWKVTKITLAPGDILEGIDIYADDSPDALDAGTFYVYFDWILVCNDYTFPHDSNIMINSPNKIAQLPIPGRKGDILQNLGHASVEITISIPMLEGERDNATNKWRSGSTEPDFSYLLVAMYEGTWNYLTCSRPLIRCQVMFRNMSWGTVGEEQKMVLNLHFIVYKLGAYSLFSDYSWIWNKA